MLRMVGAIIGDVVGSVFEWHNHRSKDFELVTDKNFFTDDTVLTVALMDWASHAKVRDSYSVVQYLQKWARKYPNSGFGGRFSREWMWIDNPRPYNSKGNGSGMRVSPVAYIARNKEELFFLSDLVTSVTHNHYEGLKGARVIAYATWMALNNSSREEIKEMAEYYYPEIAEFDYEDLKKNYKFNELSETTCPQAVYCFLISKDFEDCLRISVSIGGDTDTLCAMSCAIAEAYYGEIPKQLSDDVLIKLPNEMLDVIINFNAMYDNREDRPFNLNKNDFPSIQKRLMQKENIASDEDYWGIINALANNSLSDGLSLGLLREYWYTHDEKVLNAGARNIILHCFAFYR